MPLDRVSATRRIAAPASKLFAVVSNPAGHVEIDGSGMLEATPDARPRTGVGETFDMVMDGEPLGDIPDMGRYKVRNSVTQVPDRLYESVGSPAVQVDPPSFHPVHPVRPCSRAVYYGATKRFDKDEQPHAGWT